MKQIQMASSSNLVFHVFIGLALLLIVLQISTSECSQDWLRQPTMSSPSLEPHYAPLSEFLHLRKCKKQWFWQLLLLQSLARIWNALLLRPGGVEKNPGPAAAAAAEAQLKKNKFLNMIHVNARSLLWHFDNLTSPPYPCMR